MLLDEYVEVRVNSCTVEYYKSLGYEIPMKKATKNTFKVTGKEYVYDCSKTIRVKIGDLPKCSTIRVSVLCDMCNEEVMSVVYENYISVIEKSGTYVCKKCAYKKVKQTVRDRYGVDSVLQFDDFQKKIKKTMIAKYNAEYALQNDVLKNRARETTKKRYGVEHALQSPEIRQKVNETLCKNGIRKTSSQQLYLQYLYGGEINYPIKYYAADICLIEEKLCIEYDGGGHFLSCVIGDMTKEEFNQREIIRSNIIKREGYKQMRIISSKDLLPSDETLFQILEYTKEYFLKNPDRSWIEFNIDSSTVHNAEQKEGSYFNFGKLRKIDRSNLPKEIASEKLDSSNCA